MKRKMYPRRFRRKYPTTIPMAVENYEWGWPQMGLEMQRPKGTLEQERELKATEERRQR